MNRTGFALIALALSSGCMEPERWGRTDLTLKGDDHFKAVVAKAVAEWDEALYDRCGIVFRIVEEGGNLVEAVGPQEWLDRGYDNSAMGLYDGDQIAIADWSRDGMLNISLHELGHSLGLHHVTWDEDPRSVMVKVVTVPFDVPTAGDAKRAAEALGCP